MSTTARASRRNPPDRSWASDAPRAEARPRLAGSATQHRPWGAKKEGAPRGNHGFPRDLLVEAAGVHLVGLDQNLDALLLRVAPWVFVFAEVLLRQLVHLLVGTFLRQLGRTAYRHPFVGVVWIDHEDRCTRV